MTSDTATDLASAIGQHLPYLRRYARALTGSQTSGDLYAAATLEAILEDNSIFSGDVSPKTALFKAFHLIWSSAGAPIDEEEGGIRAKAQGHLKALTSNTREALLLQTIEEFHVDEIAQIMQINTSEVEELIGIANAEMESSVTGRVLVIEDEAIIAMDIESIVSTLGHEVLEIGRASCRERV